MYHKIIGGKKKKNQKNIRKSINYLLRVDKEEEQKFVRVLSNTTQQDILNFNDYIVDKEKSNPYVCGVLSFEEENINEELKSKITTEFEEILFKGIEEENRPPVLWVEHIDKGRLELNYLTFNSLQDRRAYTVYLNERDRNLVNIYSDIINYENNLSSPFEDRDYSNNLVNKPNTNLPGDKKELIEHLNNNLIALIASEEIENREELIKHIDNIDHIKVNRVRKNQISIKCDLFEDNKPIVLKGDIYEENRDYSDYKRKHDTTTRRNPEHVKNTLKELNSKYSRSIEARESRNRKRYKKTQERNDRENEKTLFSKNKNNEYKHDENLNITNDINSVISNANNSIYNRESVNNESNNTKYKTETEREERARVDRKRELADINKQQQDFSKIAERLRNTTDTTRARIKAVRERNNATRERVDSFERERQDTERTFNVVVNSLKKFVKPARIFAKYREHKFYKSFLQTRQEKQQQQQRYKRDNSRRRKITY